MSSTNPPVTPDDHRTRPYNAVPERPAQGAAAVDLDDVVVILFPPASPEFPTVRMNPRPGRRRRIFPQVQVSDSVRRKLVFK